jgi:DNA polymerase-3 subunit delta'
MSKNTLLPWLASDWKMFSKLLLSDHLPHALLINGPSGVGKSSFCHYSAQALLCAKPTDVGSCGECESCLLFIAGTHPDYLLLTPKKDKSTIVIDQVRKLIDELELTPLCSHKKVAVIDPADSMNVNAANCLLKTLEEPASSSVIMLSCSLPGLLPATVRSRCRSIRLKVDSLQVAENWLLQHSVKEAASCLDLIPNAPLAVKTCRWAMASVSATALSKCARYFKGQGQCSSSFERLCER